MEEAEKNSQNFGKKRAPILKRKRQNSYFTNEKGAKMDFLNVSLPEEIVREEKIGNFETAKKIIKERLSEDLPTLLKKRLDYEFERIERVIKDYPFDESSAKERLSKSIRDFSNEEYERLMKNGDLDYILINGEKHFEKRFVQNLVFANAQYAKRFESKRNDVRELVNKRITELVDGDRLKRYRVTAEISLTLKKDLNAKLLKCWLPFPSVESPIESAKLLSCDHQYMISSKNSESTTIYMEDLPKAGTKFTAKFEYTIHEQVTKVIPENVVDVHMKKYLYEILPHIMFSPYAKNLTFEIIGNEKNPYFKAKRIYDWITENVRYSYMHAYSTYDMPLVDFVISNLKGDCGVQALTFITMCRIAGIPAKWQSGWFVNPIDVSPHDWAYFYVKPYGWLPVDPSFGGSRRDIPELRDFYFGNLDAFRMIANSNFMADFDPPTRFVRSDPYDNQIGELETESGNIYYDDFETNVKVLSFEDISKST